jgi:hypothetical protein
VRTLAVASSAASPLAGALPAGALLAGALLAGVPAAAQVGYPPSASPYRDLVYHQELSLFTGRLSDDKGRAGIGLRGGPALGVRYDVRIGGPAAFTVRMLRAWSERRVLDPSKPPATRNLGTRSWPIYFGDVGITLNLTGQKSWRHLVPVVNGGIGLATDANKGGDPVGFNIGTPFAFSFGGGVRWVPGGPFQLRADYAHFLYHMSYPDVYFSGSSGATPILTGTSSQGEWWHHRVLSVGASYLFFR